MAKLVGLCQLGLITCTGNFDIGRTSDFAELLRSKEQLFLI